MKYEIMLKDIDLIEEKLNFNKERCITFFGSARFSSDNKYSQSAYKLAKKLADKKFTIITGGGGGIMEAANKGAFEAGHGKSIGINAILPNEQEVNQYVNNGMVFSTMALRKVALTKNSESFVIFPGGYGTLDELFEIFVLVQSHKIKAKIFLFGTEFWTSLIDFLKTSLLENETIKEEELEIFKLSDDIEYIYEEIIKD
ncbi:putative lysine decarboxylase family protein [Campylobacter blaseri]|uniref:Cytokinin riboside 5'-monophosphate phosphoribohydrolase n=1 Tax=Campylobacter blaseri TaxID=2042961 RepID=A0A2P8QZ93_9BACT|nr:TIGR00730 family Rossman fold protein [Campylobacter blaseri]PSM51564.1 TIGR00730 family Rossman fold protein [Campylobacter blaseri]PSM53357.1 TIGR00730 family Rossman fold protein [Campylobacter blaseri]QKF86651.1 putative lysine decarboxylase family protein [Campylobacter blaseri]